MKEIELPSTRSCFVCGIENPFGLKLRFVAKGKRVEGRFKPTNHMVGFLTVVHGGIVATVLDEVMAWACAVWPGKFAYSVEISVRYLRPIRPEFEYIVWGEVKQVFKNKLYIAESAVLDYTGVEYAHSTGKYIPVPEEQLKLMAEDLLGHWSTSNNQ